MSKKYRNKKQKRDSLLNFRALSKEIRKAAKSERHKIISPVTNSEFVIWVDNSFLPSKKEKVINSTLNFFNTNLFRTTQNEQLAEYMFYINIICAFTSFGSDIPDTYEAKIQALNYLVDIELFDIILDLFPIEELESLGDELAKKVEELQQAIDELPEQLEKAKELTEDEVIRKEIDKALTVLRDETQ